LVAGELERRWNHALQRVKEIETRIQSYGADEQRAAATPAEFARLAEQLEQVWNDPRSDASRKKRIVRTLIQEILADVESSAGEISLVIIGKAACTPKCASPGGDVAVTMPYGQSSRRSGFAARQHLHR
jgi:hypothetical protein